MGVSMIVAVAENGVIGKDNDLIWHLPADLQFFKRTTLNHHIIMGRKNYESIGRPLPKRTNVIITRNRNYQAEGCKITNSLQEAIDLAIDENDLEPFVIGGGEVYRQGLEHPDVDKIYLTHVHHAFEGDTFFAPLDTDVWKEMSREEHLSDEKNKYDFSICIYQKK